MRGRLWFVSFAALFLNATLPAAASEPPVPEGWHAVQAADFRGTEDFHFREKEKNRGLQSSGDFDGDGRIDFARVLESNDDEHCAAFITYFPGGHIAHYEMLRLDGSCIGGRGQSLFVFAVPASSKEIRTWCGKGGFCERSDTRFLRLNLSGVRVGLYETSSSIIYWDPTTDKWRKALISD